MASYDDAIVVPPKPEGVGWPEHVYRLIAAHGYTVDLTDAVDHPALRFSRADFDDLVRAMGPYTVPIEANGPVENRMYGCPIIVDDPSPSKETHGL